MQVDEFLLDRLRNLLQEKSTLWEEKKMFGGYCFMVDDKMCFGTYQGGLMARVNAEEIPALIKIEGAKQMLHGGRVMTSFMHIEPDAYDLDEDLGFWIGKCLEFNPLAKRSKKSKKK